ncbi:hypothetical protein VP1G_06249 [Cytospora mali]|uniref:Uncharacterized protein n=1 Tax=Cytospora mali TaxID=578113 RepID=A0A194V553_CYTMA|nr:hypothetical protein VP1G_06249 [Valsa mali var. pyri (nom. inval.)]
MSPFFRGSVRPPRRHPRPWSMNPRLNPDLIVDETNEKEQPVGQAELRLPVTNSIYGKPAELTPVPDLPTTNGRHTPEEIETQAAVPETTNSSTAATLDPAGTTEPTFNPDDEIPTDNLQPGQSLDRSSTRDSGTAIIDSPYLNDFVEKNNSGLSPPDAVPGLLSAQGHARADSSTIGTAEIGRYSGSVYDTQVIESDEEAAVVQPTPAATGETPFETPFEGPAGQTAWGASTSFQHPAAVETPDASHIPGGFPDGFPDASSDALATANEGLTADKEPASATASTFTDGTAAVVEPLIDDAQLEVSDEFKPATAVHEEETPEIPEPLVSDEQLEVDDEFKPQMKV